MGAKRVCQTHRLEMRDWGRAVALILPSGHHQDWLYRWMEEKPTAGWDQLVEDFVTAFQQQTSMDILEAYSFVMQPVRCAYCRRDDEVHEARAEWLFGIYYCPDHLGQAEADLQHYFHRRQLVLLPDALAGLSQTLVTLKLLLPSAGECAVKSVGISTTFPVTSKVRM